MERRNKTTVFASKLSLCLLGLCLILACFDLASSAPARKRPVFKPYLGFKELSEPAEVNGKFAKQSFHFEDESGLHVFLHYEVEHAEELIVNFDKVDEIETVECFKGNTIVVEFLTAQDARTHGHEWIKGTLLAGGRQWNCTNKEGQPTTILAQVDGVEVRRNFVELKTHAVNYERFFKNGKMKFGLKRFPEPMSGVDYSEAPRPPAPKFSKRALGSFLSDTWDEVKQIGGDVDNVVNQIPTVVHSIATGDFGPRSGSVSYPIISYNYDESTKKATKHSIPIDSYVNCVECYFHVDLGLSASFDIESYALNSLQITADGGIEIHVGMEISTSGQYTKEYELQLFEFKSPDIQFVIGAVPFTVSFNVPISAGYSVDVAAKAVLGAAVAGTGTVTYGIAYTGSSGDIKRINSQSIQHTGIVPTISAEVDATAQVYILPVLKMVIDMIGGPIVGLKPYVEGGISIGTEAKCAEHGNPSISAFLNAGFAVSLGAEIDIELEGNTIYKHDFDSIGLYSKKEPIATGCIKFSSELDELQNYYDWVHTNDDGTNWALCYEPLLPGVTWTGSAIPGASADANCSSFPSTLQLSFQVINQVDKGWLVIGSSNGLYSEDNWCVTQALYMFTYDNQTLDFQITPLTDNYGYADGYYMCSTNNNTQLFVYTLQGVAESDELAHLKGTSADGCAGFQLDTPSSVIDSLPSARYAPADFCSGSNGTNGTTTGGASSASSSSGFTGTGTTNVITTGTGTGSTHTSSGSTGSGNQTSSGSSSGPSSGNQSSASASSGSKSSKSSSSSGSSQATTGGSGTKSTSSAAGGSSGAAGPSSSAAGPTSAAAGQTSSAAGPSSSSGSQTGTTPSSTGGSAAGPTTAQRKAKLRHRY
eukprot:TRINITY_DN12872_c0_g1_i1.p1 TRINITY_DN12872_c0_g1~~TRINITY_DN12872_c0_g1_i1.p1  ORF type:complete len:875 (+),score=209.12 TRINITY_DN12872_c0_g1_i1:129-2753(+)